MPRCTILVVEDNPITRKMLRLALEAEGYSVVEAADARSAVAAFAKVPPDLVLQDLILPDMDGVELVERLRALPGAGEVPILALSGFLSRLEEARTAQAGFTALLVKPIEPSRLIESIQRFLPQARESATRVGARHLLVVDDDPVMLKLTRVLFTQFGFDVTSAVGATRALAAARDQRPDVILSDVLMPDIDGFEFCLAVRQDPGLSDVPVVLMSSQYGRTADHEIARKAGANALVVRTPDLESAHMAVMQALTTPPPTSAVGASDQIKLKEARLRIRHLESEAATMSGLAQRCAVQAAQLSLLSGVADALTQKADIDVVLRDVLAATLDAAGISKGALVLKDEAARLQVRQAIGFSVAERAALEEFFGHAAWFRRVVEAGASVSVPSTLIAEDISRAILSGAHVASAQIVPLVLDGHGVGAMLIGATRTDVTGEDSVAFARAMGNHVVQSLELAKSIGRLSASEERYRLLLESANDAIAVVAPDGTIRELNRRWIEILRLPAEQLIGRHIRDFAPAEEANENLPGFRAVSISGMRRHPPVKILTPDGAHILMEFSNTAIELGGEPMVISIGRDVTEQRSLEEQLRQAQKLEAIGQLAGGVAHDFNNVLTAILGFSDLLLAGLPSGDPARGDVTEIKKAGQRAAGLTRQLLAFSRKQILQPKVLDVNAMALDMELMLRRLIREDIDLAVIPAREAHLVKIDPTQLELILVNLVVNAADAMSRGGKLTIETANVALDEHYQRAHLPVALGDYVMLAVTDTGSGMDEATRDRIFEPFFTTKEVGKGTGLGLATVYGIVKQSGGDISVYSEPGRGSTFKIYVPRVVETAPLEGVRRFNGDMPRGSETILLVEDDDAVRLLARVTLERAGYRVIEEGNPKLGFRAATEFDGPIHLLLSDLIMPESEGPPLFGRLIEMRPGLRVLYMSGYADEAAIRHGVLIEGTPFLQKPFSPLALAQKVREVLDAPAPSRSAAN